MNRDSLAELTKLILHFRDERDWKQFHNIKDMTVSLTLEVAELLELTQWHNGEELETHWKANREAVSDELADILSWLLLIADDQQIDLAEAFRNKLAKTAIKYPVEKAKSQRKKYTEL